MDAYPDLLSIGEFARRCQLTVTTLRYYHDLGLLEPAHVHPATGYRFYRPEQAARGAALRPLRELEMPLPEIRELLHTGDPQRVKTLIARHQHRLAGQLACLALRGARPPDTRTTRADRRRVVHSQDGMREFSIYFLVFSRIAPQIGLDPPTLA